MNDITVESTLSESPTLTGDQTETIAATEAKTSPATGPRTATGKASSSQNALKTGLFAARDFIRPGEEDEYQTNYLALMRELDPRGILEQVFADEIMSANWRLRRCRIIEAILALAPETPESESGSESNSGSESTNNDQAKTQRSVDRARAHSHVILRRSVAELRKLQTERAIRANIQTLTDMTRLVDSQKLLQAINASPFDDQPDDNASPLARRSGGIDLATLEALMTQADKQLSEQVRRDSASPFCTPSVAPTPRAAKTPRNAPCPCGSGMKFKKCCGNPAAAPRKFAA